MKEEALTITQADTALYLIPLLEEMAALARRAGLWRTRRLLVAAARAARRESDHRSDL